MITEDEVKNSESYRRYKAPYHRAYNVFLYYAKKIGYVLDYIYTYKNEEKYAIYIESPVDSIKPFYFVPDFIVIYKGLNGTTYTEYQDIRKFKYHNTPSFNKLMKRYELIKIIKGINVRIISGLEINRAYKIYRKIRGRYKYDKETRRKPTKEEIAKRLFNYKRFWARIYERNKKRKEAKENSEKRRCNERNI